MPSLLSIATNLYTLFAFGWLMVLLSRRYALSEQPLILKSELATDLLYQLISFSYALLLVTGLEWAFGLMGYGYDAMQARLDHGAAPIAGWPVWLSLLAMFLLNDFFQYWIHRFFHGRRLWAFHAVHHAPTELDWHHALRFHPVNYWLYSTLVKGLLLVMGFPLWQVFVLGPLSVFYAVMLHANLNVTFGPLRYVLASPVFHRWHHSAEAGALDKNFAPTFPMFDLLFGTFYMPKDTRPLVLGIAGNPVPKGILGQMAYPFRRVAVK